MFQARFHYLVLPHESIKNLKALTREHIPLMKHMEKEGRRLADKQATFNKICLHIMVTYFNFNIFLCAVLSD